MLISAWQAPGRDLIANEEVAGFVSERRGSRPRHAPQLYP